MPVTIIAEAGLNWKTHQDALELAEKAKKCGADIVKYQTHFDWKHPMMTKTEWHHLKMFCDELGIIFMSTAWSFEAIDFLAEIGMTHWKIPSSEANNKKYLEKINEKYPAIAYISHGFNDSRVLFEFGCGCVTKHLYCVSKYPTEIKDLKWFKENQLPYEGYSDHSCGIIAPIIAACKGATIIEKHICLTKDCIDADVSIIPLEFMEMVAWIRHLNKEWPEPAIPPEILALKNRVQA